MKRLFLFACLFLLFGVFSCDKEEDEEEDLSTDQFPEWLQTKITELTSEFNLCEYTDVTISEYKGKKYYEVYNGIWSCYHCQLFDDQGNRPTWDSNGWNDFFANQKVVKTVPACQ